MATGGSPGSSAGTYRRSTGDVVFTFVAGPSLTGVNFGSVATPSVSGNGTQTGLAGTTLVFSQRYTASSAGTVSLQSGAGAPELPDLPLTLYLDANGNGKLDATDPVLAAPISVVTGQTVVVLVKATIPEGTPPGTVLTSVLSLRTRFANAVPALEHTDAVVLQTTVLASDSGALVLTKTVSKAVALPGDVIVYTLTFTNQGVTPIKQLVVTDSTPAFTSFSSASTVSLPSGLEEPTLTAPAIGGNGTIRWTFVGELAPGASGSVQFVVIIS